MAHQQVEITVRAKLDAFNARLRLLDYDDDNNSRVLEAELQWKDFGEYCDNASVDKYRVASQEINDVVLYDQRIVASDTLQRLNFKDVTSDWGPIRTRV